MDSYKRHPSDGHDFRSVTAGNINLYVSVHCTVKSQIRYRGIICHNMSPAKVTIDHVSDLVSKAGLKFDDAHIQDYCTLLGQFDDIVAQLSDDKDLFPRPDLSKYPRTDVYIPEDNNKGGWATMVSNWGRYRLAQQSDMNFKGHGQSDITKEGPLERQEDRHQGQRRRRRRTLHKWHDHSRLDARL